MGMPKRFPDRDEIVSVRADAEQLEPGSEGGERRRLAGRVMARRDMGKLVFLDLVDRSGRIQLLWEEERAGPVDLDLGDLVGVAGIPARTRRGEPSLAVEEAQLLAKIKRPLPDTFHGVTDTETRYRQRYLDLLMNDETRADFELRTRMVAAIRRYLDSQGFLEVETPILQPRYGGAFAEPFMTHSNELDADLYLRIATELYLKRLIVGGLERVYELGRDFRNESVSYKHAPEFTMVEWYEAYADYEDTMQRIEELVETVARETIGGTKVDFRGHEIDLAAPWKRAQLVDALEDATCGPATRQSCASGSTSATSTRRPTRPGPSSSTTHFELRRARADRADDSPRLPGGALAVRASDRGRLRRSSSASSTSSAASSSGTRSPRSTTPMSRPSALRRSGGEEPGDPDYVDALSYGMPPTGGLGLGIDRLAMVLTGRDNVRDVVLFPQLRERPASS